MDLFCSNDSYYVSCQLSVVSCHNGRLTTDGCCYTNLICPYRRDLRRRTIDLFDALPRLRVRPPLAGTPVGLTGWRPPLVRPSPPPCGWSIGFMAVPRT